MWVDGSHNEKKLLQDSVFAALSLAAQNNWTSISLPAISSGIYGYPKDQCTKVITDTVINFLSSDEDTPLKMVRICDLNDEILKLFAGHFNQVKNVKANNVNKVESTPQIVHQWSWKENNGVFVPFDPDQNYEIEVAYIKQKGIGSVEVKGDIARVKNSWSYIIDFDKMTELNTHFKSNPRPIEVSLFFFFVIFLRIF